jgi:ATP phosphoribosyltransferase
MSAPLILAVPSKGRLQQNAEAFFKRSGLELVKPRGARDYRGAISASTASKSLISRRRKSPRSSPKGGASRRHRRGSGARNDPASRSARRAHRHRLGFGFANVAVAVPQAWIDVRNMADLDDVATAFRLKHERKMRLATKYANLTRGFFAEHGVVDYRIVESAGATEGAPAAGTAEMIVDITTTGATLAANGLKVIEDGVILRSQANLVAARAAAWDKRAARNRPPSARPHRRAKARRCLSRSAHALCRPERSVLARRGKNSASPPRSAARRRPAC